MMSQSHHNDDDHSSTPPRQVPQSQAPNGSSHEPAASVRSSQVEMAQAFKDLARGEQHAATLEANLTNLESKLDALLESIEGGAAQLDQGQDGKPGPDKGEKNGSK